MVYLDLTLGLLVPFIFGALHYVVQGHRYDIIEDLGCFFVTYNVTLAYPLYLMWPAIISFISAVFAAMSLRQFIKRREAFAAHLMSNNSGETKSRYLRLMALSSTELLFALPLSVYKLIIDTTDYVVFPWISWEDTKWGFSRVDFWPRILVDRLAKPLLTVLYCGVPLSATFFFIWFGLCNESIEVYKSVFFWLLKPFGVKRPLPGSPTFLDRLFRRKARTHLTDTTASLPTFNHRSTTTGAHPSEGLHLDMDKIDFLSAKPLSKAEASMTSASDRRSSYSASISDDEKGSMKAENFAIPEPESPAEPSRPSPETQVDEEKQSSGSA